MHFNTESLREFGLRYAEAMVSCAAGRPDSAQVNSGLGWIWESAVISGRTGSWSGDVVYGSGGKAWLADDNEFTPHVASSGRKVELTMTLEMSEYAADGPDPDAEAQCAIRLGTNGCFQAWAGGGREADPPHWINVAADGVTPHSGVEYTFRIAFDYSRHVYSVDVLQDAEWVRLSAQGGVASFPVAARSERVSRVIFKGDTLFDTLFGEYIGDGTSIFFR